MKKKVLVTGAYGFIGRYVARIYGINGYFVIGIGHGRWSVTEQRTWKIDEWHECDVTMNSLQTYAAGCDIIVHCAGSGSVSFSLSNPMKDFERTVWTTHYILEYIRIYSPATSLIYPSSAAVYGNCKIMPIQEDVLLNPISPYGIHKKIVEELCCMYAQQYKVSVAILRLFSVYGNGLKKQLLWDACNKITMGNYVFWGTGDENRDWVHVEDVAQACYIAKSKVSSNVPIVNVAGGCGVKINSILKMLFASFGTELSPFFGGEINVGNPTHYVANVEKLHQWGWKPNIMLCDGIKSYVRWYKKHEKGSIYT